MRDVYVICVGMVRFGKFPDLWVEELGRQAIQAALQDAGLDPQRLGVVY